MALISKEQFSKFKATTTDLLNRVADQHVTLAVTGLSRSGKTAFITSLVNQLINEGSGDKLHFFTPVQEGRYIAAKRVPQKHVHIGRFDYDKAMKALTAEPATWPEPTQGISELRLAIRYQPSTSLLRFATDMATLYLDITDYPGEWLLDLPMLNQTFEQWSEQMSELLRQAPRQEAAQKFLSAVEKLDPFQVVDEELLIKLSAQYTELLHYYRTELGLSVIQPGRFILPGDLAGAPILQFFPYVNFSSIDLNEYQNASEDTLIGMLRARFIEYKERVVKRFYKQHFVKFDRQIVLADCLTPLNKGPESFADLQQAISLIMESFSYGQSSLFSRLFSPKIDRLLFAATKADHVTPEQHGNLVSLLNHLVFQTKQHLNFNNIQMKSLAIASVKSTRIGKALHQGKEIAVLQGLSNSEHELTTLYPGSVPSELPDTSFWQNKPFNFIEFAPMANNLHHQSLPHIRVDQMLEFLLGDKLQ